MRTTTPVTDHGLCDATGKRRFTKDGARRVSGYVRRRHTSNHAEYHCQSCGWWHVGSSVYRRRVRQSTLRPEPTILDWDDVA